MKPNQKLVDSNGVQVALFPSQQINVTQGANSPYSHAYSKNMDNSCHSGKKTVHAPVDVMCVANDYGSGLGLVLYQSINKVRLANGKTDYLSMWLMHDNNYARWEVGKVYRQGEHIYTEGDYDASNLTTGIHVHYELAIGLHSKRIKTHENGRWHIENQVHPDEVFFSNGSEILQENATGEWKGDHTYVWKKFEGGTGGGGGEDPRPTQKETLLVIGNPKDIGGFKVGNIYKVIKNTGKEVVLEKVEGSGAKKGGFAIIEGGKGKTIPFYNMKGIKITDFDLSAYREWQFYINDIGGNGDIITNTNRFGLVRLNPNDIKSYK